MKADYLAFRNAEKLVRSYASEWHDWEARRATGLDGANAEALVQMGIDAFEWLLRADRVMRQAIYGGQAQYDVEFEAALGALCKGWLETAKLAEEWVAQHARSHKIESLTRFRQCLEEMEAVVESSQAVSDNLPPHLAKLRDAALDEHRRGKTADIWYWIGTHAEYKKYTGSAK